MTPEKSDKGNSKVRSLLNDFLLKPIQTEIDSGKLDRCLFSALMRITLPLMVLVFVLIVVSVIQIGISVRLMHVISLRHAR